MKTQSMSIKEFMNRDYEKKVVHIDKKKMALRVVGLTAGILIVSADFAFASTTGIDTKARELYFGKLLVFGKWAIILKGGWDTINKALKEDFDGAKKSFFSYLIIYLILWGLPWGLDQVEDVFA